ncbi:hypothetical protein [Craterilacuibacter sp.]|uniref:hypothetical protein n=1 Tax=Craterilacuibacter sp. TaxID=2870909 RepID=UPI003F2EC07D
MLLSFPGRVILLSLSLLAFVLLSVWLPDAQHRALLMENGPVEAVSSLLYLLGAGLLLWRSSGARWQQWPWCLLLVHLAVREAGLRSTILGGKGTNLDYYLNPAIPLLLKSLALLVLVATALAGWKLLRAAPAWLRALWQGREAAWWLFVAGAYGAFAQVFDNWSKLFGAPSLLQERLFLSLEEIFELGMALALVLALHGWRRRVVSPSWHAAEVSS